jgi:hypothetical protein
LVRSMTMEFHRLYALASDIAFSLSVFSGSSRPAV